MNYHKPDLYIVGVGDQPLLNLIRHLVAGDYVENDRLKGLNERIFLRRELVSSSGDSAVDRKIVDQRKNLFARRIPNDQDIYSGSR